MRNSAPAFSSRWMQSSNDCKATCARTPSSTLVRTGRSRLCHKRSRSKPFSDSPHPVIQSSRQCLDDSRSGDAVVQAAPFFAEDHQDPYEADERTEARNEADSARDPVAQSNAIAKAHG